MADHILQYNDGGPDWCINCGQFADYLSEHCEGGNGAYDCRTPANRVRVFVEVFGVELHMPDLEYFGSDWIDAETPEEEDDGRCPDCGASACDGCYEDCPSWYADYMEREAQKEGDRG